MTLIEELKTGAAGAFDRLVAEYSQTVVGTCYNYLNNAEDAEDVAQEVFLEVYKSIHQFRKEADLNTWIYRICINKSLDLLRKRGRKKRINNLKNLFMFRNKSASSPHQQLEEEERKKILQEQIALLAENQRIALVLSQYDKLNNRKIAEIMAVSESAVESLLHRARVNLRKNLAKYFEKIP